MAQNRPENRGRKLVVTVGSDSGRFSHDYDANQFQNRHQNRRQNRHENRPESFTLTTTNGSCTLYTSPTTTGPPTIVFTKHFIRRYGMPATGATLLR
jgi:hypothetical protein